MPHCRCLLRLPRLSRKQFDLVIDTSPLPHDTHHLVSNARHVYLYYWPGGSSRQFVWSPGVPHLVPVTVADAQMEQAMSQVRSLSRRVAQGRIEEAIAQFDEAIRLDLQYADAYYNRGRSESSPSQSILSTKNLSHLC